MGKNLRRWIQRSPGDFILNVIIVFSCIASVFPIYWLLTGSVKLPQDVMKVPPDWVPTNISFANYAKIFKENPALQWMFNSVASALFATLGIILVSALCGYALSKLHFRGKRLLMGFVIAALVLPKEVYILPLYKEMVAFHWRGTLYALIIPEIAMPFGVYLMKQHYDMIPDEIMDAAKIDGCGSYRFFFKFGVPLTKPGVGALGILAFIRVWNAYLWQYVMATDKSTYTLAVGVARSMVEPDIIDYGLKYAGAAVAALPLLLIFLFFQKYFTSGITAGSVKG